MDWTYLDLKLSEDAELIAGANTSLLAQHTLAALHTFNTQHPESRLALALPAMQRIERDAQGRVRAMNGALGHLRVFGQAQHLEAFLDMEGVARLRRTGMLRRLRVREIDDTEIEGFASYHRLRAADRTTEAAVLRTERRYKRRAEQRGEHRNSHAMLRRRVRSLPEKDRRQRAESNRVFIPATSNSTAGRRFSVFIEERSAAEVHNGAINAYGLSVGRKDTEPFVVPVF
jgi:CRISPR-associated endoribonuclease Cas6/Csy4 subtype I-F